MLDYITISTHSVLQSFTSMLFMVSPLKMQAVACVLKNIRKLKKIEIPKKNCTALIAVILLQASTLFISAGDESTSISKNKSCKLVLQFLLTILCCTSCQLLALNLYIRLFSIAFIHLECEIIVCIVTNCYLMNWKKIE